MNDFAYRVPHDVTMFDNNLNEKRVVIARSVSWCSGVFKALTEVRGGSGNALDERVPCTSTPAMVRGQ